jgi:AraC-like DNA-binding protein
MIPPLNKWYPMVQPGSGPTKTDALERRAERIEEEYKQALKMKKVKDKIHLNLKHLKFLFKSRLHQ